MISINNLTMNYGGRFLFDNVSILINQGEKIGLIGRNGTGKSTLLKIIKGLETPTSGNIITPKNYTIEYLPQELSVFSKLNIIEEVYSSLKEIVDLEKRIENINSKLQEFSDFESKEYNNILNELSILNERLRILGSHTIESEIEQILIGLGFERSDFTKLYSEFSGGWQMRVELAKILIKKPNCIMLDEPTNHLDIDSIRWLEKFLKNYNGTILLISHDRTFLDNVTNRTIEVVNGKIYDLPYSYTDYVLIREQQKEQELAAYRNQQKQIAQTERFIERFLSKATLASRVQSKIKALQKIERIEIEDETGKSINIRFPEPTRSARIVVEIENLSKSYGSKKVLENINLVIERGEKIAFVGRNGEGKSTLSKIIAGLEDYSGKCQIGNNVFIGYFAQQQTSHLNENLTVFETIDNVAIGDVRPLIRTILGAFLFSGDDIYKKVKVLSGGEKSRLSLAKLMMQSYNLLILDEPTNHLDMLAKDVLKQALMDFTGSVIIVSHDREFLSGLTNKTIEFKNKKIKEYIGGIDEYLEKTELSDLNELEIKSKIEFNEKQLDNSNKLFREKRKEIQREINRRKKKIQDLENQITLLEEEINLIEKNFQDLEYINNLEKLNNLNKVFIEKKSALNKLYEEWEIVSKELIELEK